MVDLLSTYKDFKTTNLQYYGFQSEANWNIKYNSTLTGDISPSTHCGQSWVPHGLSTMGGSLCLQSDSSFGHPCSLTHWAVRVCVPPPHVLEHCKYNIILLNSTCSLYNTAVPCIHVSSVIVHIHAHNYSTTLFSLGDTSPLHFSEYTGCFRTCGHYCRRWFPRSLWSKKFI